MNAVTDVARNVNKNTYTTSTGYEVKLQPVGAMLLQQVAGSFEYPPVPKVKNPDTGFEEENPMNPDYIKECEAVDRKRGLATMSALMLFGVDLVEPIPADEEWLPKVKKLGFSVQIEDEYDRKLAFLQYIVFGADDMAVLRKLAGIDEEEVAAATDSFPGDA